MASLWCGAALTYEPIRSDPLVEPWRWRKEELLEGLGVWCMDEAENGTLWFGNDGRVTQYDGRSLKPVLFDEALIAAISVQHKVPRATAIQCLSNNRLLINVDKSVVLYAQGAWQVLLEDAGKPFYSSEFLQSEDGTLWLLTEDGLWRFAPGSLEYSLAVKGSKLGRPLSWCMDAHGDLWVLRREEGENASFLHVPINDGKVADQAQWQTFPTTEELKEYCQQIICAEDGLIWYVSRSTRKSIRRYDPQQKEWLGPLTKEANTTGYSYLLKQDDGSVIVGQVGSISRYADEGKKSSFLLDKLGAPYIFFELFKTSKDRLWVTSDLGYIYSVDLSSTEWKTFPGLNYCCETQRGIQWFSSQDNQRVVSYNSTTKMWLEYQAEDLRLDEVFDLFYSSHGIVWATGIYQNHAAVSVYDGKKWMRCKHPLFAREFGACRPFEDRDGTVWIGAYGRRLRENSDGLGGALQFKVNQDASVELLKHYAQPIFPYHITTFERTPDGVLWLGSSEVYTYDGESPSATPEHALKTGRTIDIVLDRHQSLWVAKSHVGIYRKKGDEWKLFTMKDGLAGLKYVDLLLLQDDSLLASSEQGISRFDGKTWTPFAYPSTLAVHRIASKMHQTLSGDIWLNYQRQGKQKLLLPETKGVCAIRHRPEKEPPQTFIKQYVERVSPQGNMHVTWTGKDPWNSTPKAELQYAWRMDNGDWSTYSHLTSHTFLNLNRGRHRFDVRARDRAFNVDTTPARVEFYVNPPVWMQPWFIVLMLLFSALTVCLLRLLIRARERNLRKEQQHLVELDQLKMGFFTNISHELRTPLTVITGRTEMVLRKEGTKEIREDLSLIQRNAERLTSLVTQLLDLRKIEANRLSIQLSAGDIVLSLKEWISCLTPLASRSNITILLDCMRTFYGSFDFDKIQKIVTNLVSNAIKYTKKNGQIRVCFSINQSGLNSEKKQMQLIVEDNGIGIQKKHVDHIFDRFYRVTEESLIVGAGIGLDLTKELVNLLEGSIKVESPIYDDTNRPGTRFIVELPIIQEPKELAKNAVNTTELKPLKPLAATMKQETVPLILVVEDEEEIRDLIVENLSSTYQIIEAENGHIGLCAAKKQIPDLIVTDLIMPELDGVAMCDQLKNSIETSHIPIVMLTAKASIEHQLEGLRIGADDYVTKPFNMELLEARIANLLESRRLLCEKFCQANPILTSNIPEQTLDKAFLDHVMAVLKENYADPEFKLDEFSSALHMSLSTLKRKLKAVTDRTPGDILNEFRMMKAAERLAQNSETITEIAYAVGCDNASNFSRLFKKYYHVTPSAFRETQQSL